MSKTPHSASSSTESTSAFLQTEFFAEDTLVSITPTFECPALTLVSGDFGPFKPSIAAEVPLWLALTLKKLNKCSIRPPEWLQVEELEETLRIERRATNLEDDFDGGDADLQKLPKYFSQVRHVAQQAQF